MHRQASGGEMESRRHNYLYVRLSRRIRVLATRVEYRPRLYACLDPTQGGHRFPKFLPDGRHSPITSQVVRKTRGSISVSKLMDLRSCGLLDADQGRVVFMSGQLLFVRQERCLHKTSIPVWARLLTGNYILWCENKMEVAVNGQRNGGACPHPPQVTSSIARVPQAGLRQFLWLDRGEKEVGRSAKT